jgi:Na+-transporting NADH:ubiquinone oxidoreductase subunit A
LFVTALDAEPMAPSVATIIDAFADEFSAAVDLLSRVSEAPLYVCHAPAYQPRLSQASGAICKAFDGDHRAGLAGRHIQALCPIGFAGGEVWHIGYQQVIALGHLLTRGRPWAQRVIALGGDAVKRPRSLLVPVAASIDDLLDGEVEDGPVRILNGSAIYGREVAPGQAFLGADQRQLTVNRGAAETGEVDEQGTIIPGDWLEALAPPGIYPVPLLRALQLGDAERARELGALELVEEDLAPLSHACVSNSDYGLLLRRVLDELEGLR